MRLVAIDTETHLISYPNQVNPDMVVLSYAYEDCDGLIDSGLAKNKDAEDKLTHWFTEASKGRLLIIGANIAFDLCVILKKFPELEFLIWESLKKGSISDIQLRERLYLISTIGRHNAKRTDLGSLVDRYLNIEMSGKSGDVWRFKYGELENVPLEKWPKEAVDYAIMDAIYTLKVWKKQKDIQSLRGYGSMNSENIQVASAFALRILNIEGILINQDKVKDLKKTVEAKYNHAVEQLKTEGIINEEGKRNQAKVRELAKKVGVTAKTDKGNIKTDKKTLQKHQGKSEILDSYLEYSDTLKAVTTFIPQMGFNRIHPSFNPLVSTLRTSCYSSNYYKYQGKEYGKRVIKRGDPVPSINLQQIPRDARFRAPFIPEKNHVFIDSDYTSLELACFAQTCYNLFGYSEMRDALNSGQNLHDTTGAAIYSASYGGNLDAVSFHKLISNGDPKAKESRQIAKIINLGIPGGQGKLTIMKTARMFGLNPDSHTVDEWIQIAKTRFKEFNDYFRWLRKQEYVPGFFAVDVEGVWLSRRRYTEAANCKSMQTLGALGAKVALVKLVRACRDKSKGSTLYGSSCKAVIHDEFLISTPDYDIINKCREKAEIMLEGLSYVIPDVRLSCTVDVQDYWAKEATPGREALEYTYFNGELKKVD